MWQAVYYQHYDEHEEEHWQEPKVLPYSILCKDNTLKKELCKLLGKYGYKGVGGNTELKAFLVNTQFKRWCYYPKPVSMSRINNRDYSFEEIQPILYENRKK